MTRLLRVVEQYNKGLLHLSSSILSVKQELSKGGKKPEKYFPDCGNYGLSVGLPTFRIATSHYETDLFPTPRRIIASKLLNVIRY